MKVNVIYLNYNPNRDLLVKDVFQYNKQRAGYPFDHIEIVMLGISAAINKGLQLSKGYDAVVTMSNDILMPENWLAKMVAAAEAIPNTGSVGFHCVERLPEAKTVNGVMIHEVPCAFGNNLFPMRAVNAIGYWNTDFDPYGMQDADYAYRLKCSGFINYYLTDKAEHIGHDVGQPSDYRRMKDEGLIKGMEVWTKATTKYNETGDYTINMNEYY